MCANCRKRFLPDAEGPYVTCLPHNIPKSEFKKLAQRIRNDRDQDNSRSSYVLIETDTYRLKRDLSSQDRNVLIEIIKTAYSGPKLPPIPEINCHF